MLRVAQANTALIHGSALTPDPALHISGAAASHQGLELLGQGLVDPILLQILVLKALHCQGQLCYSGGRAVTEVKGSTPIFSSNPPAVSFMLSQASGRDPSIHVPGCVTLSKSLLSGPQTARL